MHIGPSRDVRPAQQSDRHSPCVGVCTLDPAMGWCLGCGRTGDEIASWIGLDDAGRLAIWNELRESMADAAELARRQCRQVAEVEQQRATAEAKVDEQRRIRNRIVDEASLHEP